MVAQHLRVSCTCETSDCLEIGNVTCSTDKHLKASRLSRSSDC